MNILRYYLLLFTGVFVFIGFLLVAGSLFIALLPLILPLTIILILAAIFSGRRKTVIYNVHENFEGTPIPPASEDTIDIKAVEIKDEKHEINQ